MHSGRLYYLEIGTYFQTKQVTHMLKYKGQVIDQNTLHFSQPP